VEALHAGGVQVRIVLAEQAVAVLVGRVAQFARAGMDRRVGVVAVVASHGDVVVAVAVRVAATLGVVAVDEPVGVIVDAAGTDLGTEFGAVRVIAVGKAVAVIVAAVVAELRAGPVTVGVLAVHGAIPVVVPAVGAQLRTDVQGAIGVGTVDGAVAVVVAPVGAVLETGGDVAVRVGAVHGGVAVVVASVDAVFGTGTVSVAVRTVDGAIAVVVAVVGAQLDRHGSGRNGRLCAVGVGGGAGEQGHKDRVRERLYLDNAAINRRVCPAREFRPGRRHA
jgi:hypothetical protein